MPLLAAHAQVKSMSKLQDRKNIVSEINNAASLYRRELVGKRFLYVFDGRYIEVIFKAQNFRHLTGVATDLSAKRFYSYAARRMLAASQIWFDKEHPYDLCARKAKHLSQIASMMSSESFILEELTTEKKTFKFGATDLNFTLCLDMEYDETGSEKGECYVVESLRDEDCFSKSKNIHEITHILARPNDAKLYSQLLFVDPRFTLDALPKEVKAMLSANFDIII